MACPDTAILAKALRRRCFEGHLAGESDEALRKEIRGHWTKTRKYFDVPVEKGQPGALFRHLRGRDEVQGLW